MRWILIVCLIALAGCTAFAFGSPPAPDSDPAAALVARLAQSGATVRTTVTSSGEPLSAAAAILCVNNERVQVFTFETDHERDAAANHIDRDDPSHVGTSIVEWIGTPQFWTADRAVVLYAGDADATIAALSSLLGEPFARGRGMDRGMVERACE